MNKISGLTDEIIRERESIWQEAPPELEILKSHQKGRAGNVSVRIYAFADAYRNQRNLWLLRDSVKTKKITIEIAISVLAPFLREMADRFEIWTLFTPSRLFRKVERLEQREESQSPVFASRSVSSGSVFSKAKVAHPVAAAEIH